MTLDISHYREIARDVLGSSVQAGREPALSTDQVVIGAGSLQSAPFPDNCALIRVHAAVTCRIAIGADPTAAATSPRMAAGQTEFFGVMPGHRIAVITST